MMDKQFAVLAKFLLLLISVSFVVSCASLPIDAERTESHALQNTDDSRLGQAIVPIAKEHPDQSGFFLLNKGMDAFAARLTLIEWADKSLDVQYYIWHDDLTGNIIQSRLLHAADRGVRVRLLLDDLDTAGKEETLHIMDSHPNLEIRLFNPFANRNVRAMDFASDLSRVNHRMHNKSLTADNQATIVGGRNIGDEYFEATEGVAFTDADVLGVGPVVNEVSSMFDLYWNSKWVYPLSAFKEGEPVTEAQRAELMDKLDQVALQARDSAYAEAVRNSGIMKEKEAKLASEFNIAELPYTWGKWFLIYDQPSKVEADEVKEETHLGPQLAKALRKTQHDLIVISPYFVPGEDITAFFNEMVKNGIRVRILTNSLAANDVPIVHAGYMRYRKALVKGGVELYEFKPRINEAGEVVKTDKKWTGSSGASLHAKSFAFDEQFVFVGSFNLDGRSIAINTEMGVFYEDPEIAKRLSKNFDSKLLTVAYRVTLDDENSLKWTTAENGKEVTFDAEPETSWWTRFSTGFLSIFVIESQL
jgi:putative cardiolipin synthase